MRKGTKENFIKQANIKHNNFYSYEKFDYINNKTKGIITCPIHGDFEMTPNDHLRGHKCPFCAGTRRNKEEFVRLANIKHNSFYSYKKFNYKNKRTKGIITCPIHGDFEMTPEAHLRGNGCKQCCLDKIKSNKSEFVKKANIVHNNFYTYDHFEYTTCMKKSWITCPIHGDFEMTPNNHLRKHGCPYCKKNKGETAIENYLIENNIIYEREKRFKDCKNKLPLPFDFYLPKLNTCIEYDGIQHFKENNFFGGKKGFKKRRHNDQIKNKYCYKNKINLIRINYNDDIKKELDKELLFITL